MEEQRYAIARKAPEFMADFVAGKPYRAHYSNTAHTHHNEWHMYRIRNEDGEERLVRKDDIWTIVKESDLTPEQRRMAGLPTEDATIAELREQLNQMKNLLQRQQDRDTKVFDELSERIEALEARVPVEEKAEPEKSDEFFFIDRYGNVAQGLLMRSGDKFPDYMTGIYKTKEQAESRARQIRMVVEELNNGRPVTIRDGRVVLYP